MTKIFSIVLCIFVGSSAVVKGDAITLRNEGKDIDLKVTGVTEEYITAIIPKKELKSVNMQFLDSRNYPDVIFLNGTNIAVECRVKEIAEDTITVIIPTALISSLKMSFLPGDKQVREVSSEIEGKPKTMDVDVVVKKEKEEQAEERRTESRSEDGGEGGIADAIRTSPVGKMSEGKYYRLRTKKKKVEKEEAEGELPGEETEDVTEDVDEKTQEPGAEVSEREQKLASEFPHEENGETVKEFQEEKKPVVQDQNLGRVEGRIFHSGKPLPDCQVKLQMLEKGGLLTKGYRPVEGAIELETTTDKDGMYHFMNVSPGLYKLYWKPPSDTTWVRRFKMEPDVIVTAGKLTTPKDIETLKRTLN